MQSPLCQWAVDLVGDGVRPASGHQSAVPDQQSCRRHAESRPRRTGEQATEDGQKGAIGGFVGITSDMAPKDLHLMAQSEELNLLRGFGAKRQKEQVEHATDNEVEEGPQLTSDLMPSHRDDGSRRGRQSA